MDEVEAVARAICATRGLSPDALYQHHEWEPWPIDRRDEYVGLGGEVRINLMHYAWRRHTESAEAAIAALDAARGNAEPVAASRKWANALANIRQGRRSEPLCEPPSEYAIENALEWLKDALLASPTPLYAHPPAPDAALGDPVARVVEWLRKENGLCDCHARCETECGCGAWDDWKTKPLLEIADAIEQSFANKT